MSEKNYRYVRLTSGESVIADVQQSEDKSYYILRFPLQVLVEKGSLVIFPFLPISSSDDREVTFHNQHILFTCSLIPKIQEMMDSHSVKLYQIKEPKEDPKEPKNPPEPAGDLNELFSKLNEEITKGKKPS